MIRIPFTFNGSVAWQDYDAVLTRINAFSSVSDIGKDQSGTYDMKLIQLGNPTKPKMLIQTCMHPPEWHTMQYTLPFFEMLRDDTFPDTAFRNELLSSFHLLYIPMVNPWGYNALQNSGDVNAQFAVGRENSAGKDLNDDFYEFTQQESKNVKSVVDTFKPFSFWDEHMFQQNYDLAGGKNLIIGNGTYPTVSIRRKWANAWKMYSGETPHEWEPNLASDSGLARAYVKGTKNPYTNQTLAYITEIVKPSTGFTPILSLSDIYSYGMASVYLFFQTSMDYYYKRAQ